MLNKKKSAIWRFFLLCLFCYQPVLAADHSCSSEIYDESASVKYTHDGDTVKLRDGRKIRLIGINAPELARDGQKAEAYALQARDRLRSLLASHNNQIKIIHGQESKDHYQRHLSHLFLPDGTNLQAQLLSSGLVSAITIAPNDRFSDCYQQTEKKAFCAKKALWSREITRIADLENSANGFRVLKGRVKKIDSSRSGLWLTFDHGLNIRIASKNKSLFDMQRLNNLVGQAVIVRGWLQSKKHPKLGERFYMQIKHPSSIEEEKTALKC